MTKRSPLLLTLFLISLFLLSLTAHAQEKTYDYVIKNTLVFDGESLLPVKRDIALLGDQIVQIGEIAPEDGREVIEAEGLVASPGFIDSHTHSDFNPFVYPNLANKVLQGVTTEVVGNCGMSAAPVAGSHKSEIANVWSREGVEIPPAISWESFYDYRSEAEFQGLDTNFIALVGHGNIRSAVMGNSPASAGPGEIQQMKDRLNQALGEGAVGVSFGLTYLPGIFASREELTALCEEAAKEQKICAFHIRSEGRKLVESVEEAIEVARVTGAHVHISHLKAAGESNWPKIQEAFQKIESARADGLKVTADAYPYIASFAELGVVLPDEIYQDPNRVSRLKEMGEMDGMSTRHDLQMLEAHYQAHPVSWDSIRVATVRSEKNKGWQGKSLLEISKVLGKSPVETLVELLAEEEFKVSAFYFSQSEAVTQEILSKPYVAVGSDSIADGSAAPHPRAYGTFPRILARCRKAGGVMNNPCWGRAIHQMTGLPARIFGLKNRGRIGTGLYADIVLFDPLQIKDRADYDNPKAPPEGIRWVFVNGKAAVREGQYEPLHTGVFLDAEK